ncbi:glycosyltransferase [Anaeromusa sp.]|uniref:glycosyltransferase n=1 Tax=Anaeromusa sp. TaxID=1872520 RepID=UPI00261312B8|nr:glycosyltransferase [Anaeromusa sp.]MDD3157105.1 glycosyltransferase [Anaeromusa sp.]
MNEQVLLKYMPLDAKLVVELGCGEGLLGAKWLSMQPFGQYIGVEAEAAAARKGAGRLSRVHVLKPHLTTMPQLGIHGALVDCLVVTERTMNALAGLEDLELFLKSHLPYLSSKAVLVLLLPNSRFIGRVQKWLEGAENAEKVFAAPAVQKLLERLGFSVTAAVPQVQRSVLRDAGAVKLAQSLLPFAEAQGISAAEWEREAFVAAFVLQVSKTAVQKPLLLQTMMGEMQVCARVRVMEPDAFLNTIPGVRALHEPGAAKLSLARPEESKILIRQRIWADLPEAALQQRKLLALGYLTVAEIDDDPERWLAFHSRNGFFAFRGSHAVQVSTPALAECIKQWNPNVAVFPNQLAQLPLLKKQQGPRPVRLFFGALNREADWQPYLQDVNEVLGRLGSEVEVVVIHDQQLYASLGAEKKVFQPFCPYSRYVELLRSCDVAWLPLEDNRFNRMKSDLKFLECAGHQVAALASPTVYKETVQDGVTGFLYRSREELRQRLEQLLRDGDLRRQLGANAYAWVKEERLLSQHYRRRYEWYQFLTAHKERLDAELLQRAPEIIQ